MKKIVILTCFWKRYDIASFFVQGVNRLKNDNKHLFNIEVVGVVSHDPKLINLCKKNNIRYVNYPNLPLGKKWNTGLKYCHNLNPDYILIMGSDNIFSSNIMSCYYYLIHQGFDFIGLSDLYFYNIMDKRLIYWSGYKNYRKGESIGLGRMLSRCVLDKIDWKLWDDNRNRGLDNSMSKILKSFNIKQKIISAKKFGFLALDIKSDVNICKFESYRGKVLDPEITLKKYFPKEEYLSIMYDVKNPPNYLSLIPNGKSLFVKKKSKKFSVLILVIVPPALLFTDIFMLNLNELIKNNPFIKFNVIAIGPENEKLYPVFRKYNHNYFVSDMKYLGRCLNEALKQAKILEPDYVMIMEMNRFISANYFHIVYPLFVDGFEYIGIIDKYIYCLSTNRLIHWKGYQGKRESEPIRQGRIVNKDILNHFKWSLWDDHENVSIDYCMTKTIGNYVPRTKLLTMSDSYLIVLDMIKKNSEFKKFIGVKKEVKKFSEMLDENSCFIGELFSTKS